MDFGWFCGSTVQAVAQDPGSRPEMIHELDAGIRLLRWATADGLGQISGGGSAERGGRVTGGGRQRDCDGSGRAVVLHGTSLGADVPLQPMRQLV